MYDKIKNKKDLDAQYGIKINHDFVLTGDSIIRHKQQLQRRLDSTNGTQPSSFFATAEDCKAFINIDSKINRINTKQYAIAFI